MARPIYSITPFTMLDYPDKAACIFWFAGCNMRCLYCYNPDIVTGKGKLGYSDGLKFLDKRRGLLDGVVLSGGECTLHKGLPDFITEVKDRGLQVKIDTNGSTPKVLEDLLKNDKADYIALDFKAPPKTFRKVTVSNLYGKFEQSLKVLLANKARFEVRTTFHSDLISADDLHEMVSILSDFGYSGNYFIQHFVHDTPTLSPLSRSKRILNAQDFSTSTIQVIFRA